MTQEQVRRMFIKANPGVKRFGKKGLWYRCAHCGKWCGRSGPDHVNIPASERMEVDHIIPFSKGGLNTLSNLQPLCMPCNRSKSNNQGGLDTIKGVVKATANGDLLSLAGSMALTSLGSKIGIKRKRK